MISMAGKAIRRWWALFALPTFAAFIIGFLVPFIMGVYLSFCEFTTVTDGEWVGLKNYGKALKDKEFLHALGFSTAFTIVTTMMIIYIAGLQALPTDVLEAAAVDGANGRQTMFRIIIPLMMPSITVCSFLTVTNGFKLYDQNLALTNGAPSNMSEGLALNITRTFYGRMGWEGVGQAKAVLFFILVAVIALIQNKLTTSKEVAA